MKQPSNVQIAAALQTLYEALNERRHTRTIEIYLDPLVTVLKHEGRVTEDLDPVPE